VIQIPRGVFDGDTSDGISPAFLPTASSSISTTNMLAAITFLPRHRIGREGENKAECETMAARPKLKIYVWMMECDSDYRIVSERRVVWDLTLLCQQMT